MLITGGEHEDRVKYATQLVQRLLCENLAMGEACSTCASCTRVLQQTHPNFLFIEPSLTKDDGTKAASGVIKIDQIREVISASNKTNFEPGISVFVIAQMHQTTKPAANALLKVMEENKRDKVFIALAPSRTSVLATIASRLVVHQVAPNLAGYSEKNLEMQQRIFSISRARPALRFAYCEEFGVDRDSLSYELQNLVNECHVMLRTKEGSPLFILKLREALERAMANLKTNLNPRLVVERLVLREWPTIH
jgi:hypothetical protein